MNDPTFKSAAPDMEFTGVILTKILVWKDYCSGKGRLKARHRLSAG